MSNKSQRRRRRKHRSKKQNDKTEAPREYEHKFRCIEASGISKTILAGYFRDTTRHLFSVIPPDVESICIEYLHDEKVKLTELDQIIPQITSIVYDGSKYGRDKARYLKEKAAGTLKIKHITLEFNDIFNALASYEKMLVLRRILRQKVYPIHTLIVYSPSDIDEEKSRNFLSEQLFFTEYVMCKRYSTLQTLDLSEMHLNDNDMLYLCNAIENLVEYNTQRKQKKLQAKQKQTPNESNANNEKQCKQKPAAKKKKNKSQKKKHNAFDSDEEITANLFGKNSKAVFQILEQQKKQKLEELKHQKVEPVKMKLTQINLSYNNVTDKYFALFLRAINSHLPELKSLNLSVTDISNNCLSWIIKYDIRRLVVDLSGCTGVTLNELNKYSRTEMFDEATPQQYVYCKDMVYFVNEQEEKQEKRNEHKGGRRIRGKGKKFRGNRKRMLFTGRDGIETGYLSDGFDAEFWDA